MDPIVAHFELLLAGPTRLLKDGVPLALGQRKALALLAWLALEPGGRRERGAALLWPDQSLAAGRRNLRRELFRLRALGVPLRQAADGALVLDVAMAVDVLAAEPPGGVVCDGLDGVAGAEFDSWLMARRAHLARQRDLALERAAADCLARGDPAGALARQLERLAADACQEDVAMEAMRLRIALGDRAGALGIYRRLAAALRDELDIEPAAATRELAASLRQGEASPSNGVAAPPPSPSAPASLQARMPWIDRPATSRALLAAWQAGRRVYLAAAPGAGKTRLASEVAALRGPWLRVACEPNGGELPFALALRLLRQLREAAPDVALPDWARRELAQLMPEFGSAPLALGTDEARSRLLAAFAAAWTLLLRDNFSVLFVDDWQWADSASIGLWDSLDAAAAEAGVALITAYRSAQLPAAALHHWRADVDAGHAVTLTLPAWSANDVLALVRALSGSQGGALFAQRLQQATDGNPFFLIETLRHLFEQGLLQHDPLGGWATPFDDVTHDYAELPVPPTVRDAVQARVRALGPQVQRTLETASLLGGEFESALLADADAEETTLAACEHAAAAQLVIASRHGYRFTHDLVRQCLAEGLSPVRRQRLHARLAERLQSRGAAPAVIAAQWEAALAPAAALAWRVRAAAAAQRVHAQADALLQYGHALADGACGAEAVNIHLACAALHRQRADAGAADEALAAAQREAAGADATLRLEVALARVEHRCGAGRIDDATLLLDALAPDLRDASAPQRARALSARATTHNSAGRVDDARACQLEAIRLLEGATGAGDQLADILDAAARTALRAGDRDAAQALAQRAALRHEASGNDGGLAHAQMMLGVLSIYAGEPRETTRRWLEQARALAARCGHVPVQRGAILNLVKLHTDVGETGPALALLDEGEALAPGFEHARAEIAFMEARYYVLYLRADAERAALAADRLLAACRRLGELHATIGAMLVVADLHLHTGALEPVHRLLDEGDALAATAGPARAGYIEVPLQHKRAWLLLAEGDAAAALTLLRGLPASVRFEDGYAAAWIGAAAALALGEHAEAARWCAAADIEADAPTDALAMLLAQRLALAAATQREDGAARQRAQALLADDRVPAFEAVHLRAALQRPINASSTPRP